MVIISEGATQNMLARNCAFMMEMQIPGLYLVSREKGWDMV